MHSMQPKNQIIRNFIGASLIAQRQAHFTMLEITEITKENYTILIHKDINNVRTKALV